MLPLVTGVFSFLVAAYLVNMTLLNQLLTQRGEVARVALPPTSRRSAPAQASAALTSLER